jgi:hypothetical protein
VKNWVGIGDNLGGLWLKEIRPFVGSSTETYATFVVSRTLETNLVLPCASCDLLSAAYLLFLVFFISKSRVAQFSLYYLFTINCFQLYGLFTPPLGNFQPLYQSQFTQLTQFSDQNTLSCIKSECVRHLTYHKYEVTSLLTPSTDESHFLYDIARHPKCSSQFDTL